MWQSKIQSTIALSSTEAEYIALSTAAQEGLWIRSLLKEWGYSMMMPSTLWCDNQGAIQLSTNPSQHKRTKHVDIKYHFIRHLVESGQMVIGKVHTSQMIADVLTKNTSRVVNDTLNAHLFGQTTIRPSPERIEIYKRNLKQNAHK